MGFFEKIKNSLTKTKKAMSESLGGLFSAFTHADEDFYEELEERMILADLGVETSMKAVSALRTAVKEKKLKTAEELHGELKNILTQMLMVGEQPLKMDTRPSVVLFIGVNGVGKTTTIGKLAAQYKAAGHKVILGAADTFRAAAIEQLEEWARRADVEIVKQKLNSDAASVAHDAVASALAKDADVVLIDTAGRLHNKVGLMNELSKIKRVIEKLVPGAPHSVLLVLDGSTGQNAIEQTREFSQATEVTDLAITKLDGTAKGGVVIGISDQFKIPVRYIGLGEKIEDLQVFDKHEFVKSLFEVKE